MGTIEDIRKALQDFLAPELRANTAKIDSLEKQMSLRLDALAATMDAFRAEMRAEFASLRSNSQLDIARQVGPLSERLAVVEAKVH
jgi:outer membrane murein-binding lipoprotein Lpp